MPDDLQPEPTSQLIQGLLLEVGRLMEFESANLALILPQDRALVVAHIEHLHQSASDILALAEAARVLVRRLSGTTATI